MSEQSDFQQDEDAYWRSSKEFVRLLIAEMNQSPKSNRISTRKRKQICKDFAFVFCSELDQRWIKPRGQTEYPLLCFSTKFFDVDVPIDLAQINFPGKSVEMHAMVTDEIEWFFDEMKENTTAVCTGNVDDETTDIEVDESVTLLPQHVGHATELESVFCLRKGKGDPADCPRCRGCGQCQHCAGSGRS